MKRCTHAFNVRLLEHGTAFTEHVFEHGYVSHYHDFGNYDRTIEVECMDCGYHRTFRKRRPKWVERWVEFFTSGCEDTVAAGDAAATDEHREQEDRTND
jgi:hypothetical protein